MDDGDQLHGESILAAARRRAANLGFKVETLVESPPEVPTFDPDLVPDEAYESKFAEERAELDEILGRINVVAAYNKYTNKMHCDPKGKTESIMVRCPFPGHLDEESSAWLTTKFGDGVGNCPLCGGFDKYDLAAWHYGFDVPGYKMGSNFPALRIRMAEGLGYTVVVSGKDEWLERIQPTIPVSILQSKNEVSGDEPNVIPFLYPDEEIEYPSLDWRCLPFIAPNTFMYEWMTETSRLHQPEEFYLFAGFAAMALAVGNNATMDDEDLVRPNTMICLVGGTGTGKSRSVSKLMTLLGAALPFHETTAAGVKMIHSPGSGEDLVNQFIYSTVDPATKEVATHPVRGLIYEDEFEGLMAKVNKPNSTLRANLMKFFDSDRAVSKSSQTHGAAIARNHFMQALTTTQPKRLGSLMTTGDATSGFLNRFMFVFGTEKFRPSVSDVRIDVRASADLLQNIRAWASPGQSVSLVYDPVALNLWDELVQTQIRLIEKSDDVLVSRIELQCKKLLLLMAINDHSTAINEQHMVSLILMFPYLKQCYGLIEDGVGKTHLEHCIEAMQGYFEAHPDADVTMRVLAKQSAARKFDNYTRAKAIELLIKNNTITETPRARDARSIKWRLVLDEPVHLATVTSIK